MLVHHGQDMRNNDKAVSVLSPYSICLWLTICLQPVYTYCFIATRDVDKINVHQRLNLIKELLLD